MVSKTSRRAFLGTIGGLAVGVLAACQQAPAPAAKPAESKPAEAPKPTAPAAAGSPKRGGELRIVQINDFVSMDPIHASGPTAKGVYDSLFAWRPNAQGVY